MTVILGTPMWWVTNFGATLAHELGHVAGMAAVKEVEAGKVELYRAYDQKTSGKSRIYYKVGNPLYHEYAYPQISAAGPIAQTLFGDPDIDGWGSDAFYFEDGLTNYSPASWVPKNLVIPPTVAHVARFFGVKHAPLAKAAIYEAYVVVTACSDIIRNIVFKTDEFLPYTLSDAEVHAITSKMISCLTFERLLQ